MKFSSVGLFSGGNNVKNASFDEWSATCCGFTDLEVRQMLELFPDTPEDITMEELKDNFNGYRFSFVGEELVYNPGVFYRHFTTSVLGAIGLVQGT
eukprot:gene2603-biopygen2094